MKCKILYSVLIYVLLSLSFRITCTTYILPKHFAWRKPWIFFASSSWFQSLGSQRSLAQRLASGQFFCFHIFWPQMGVLKTGHRWNVSHIHVTLNLRSYKLISSKIMYPNSSKFWIFWEKIHCHTLLWPNVAVKCSTLRHFQRNAAKLCYILSLRTILVYTQWVFLTSHTKGDKPRISEIIFGIEYLWSPATL